MLKNIFIIFFYLITFIQADVKSLSGKIEFKPSLNEEAKLTLNSIGLGIGVSPSTNLHVLGNALVSDQIFIGQENGSSNLSIQGTVGYNIQRVNSSTSDLNSTFIFCDTSSDNITVTLPDPSTVNGQVYHLKKVDEENDLYISSNTYIDQSHFSELTLNGDDLPYVKLMSIGQNYITLSSSQENPYTAWEPTSMSNLLAWYDASDVDTIVLNSGNVDTWRDKSGYGFDMNQSTSTRQPYYSTSDNVTFVHDEQQSLMHTSVSDNIEHENLTIVCLFYPQDISTAHIELFGHVGVGTQEGINARVSTGSTYVVGTHRTDFIGGKPVIDEEQLLFLHNGDVNGLESRYVFRDVVSSTAKNTVDALTNNNFYLGGTGVNSRTFEGYIKEFLIINEDLNEENRQLLEGYIAWKWGRQSDLPSDHPYRTDGSRFGN